MASALYCPDVCFAFCLALCHTLAFYSCVSQDMELPTCDAKDMLSLEVYMILVRCMALLVLVK